MVAQAGYLVEGWTRHECVAVRRVVRPATAVREAYHQALDRGAAMVWVRRQGSGQALYVLEGGMSWRKYAGDDDLALAIDLAQQ